MASLRKTLICLSISLLFTQYFMGIAGSAFAHTRTTTYPKQHLINLPITLEVNDVRATRGFSPATLAGTVDTTFSLGGGNTSRQTITIATVGITSELHIKLRGSDTRYHTPTTDVSLFPTKSTSHQQPQSPLSLKYQKSTYRSRGWIIEPTETIFCATGFVMSCVGIALASDICLITSIAIMAPMAATKYIIRGKPNPGQVTIQSDPESGAAVSYKFRLGLKADGLKPQLLRRSRIAEIIEILTVTLVGPDDLPVGSQRTQVTI